MTESAKHSFQENLIYRNPEKTRIARDMLHRYTGSQVEEFQQYIILTNFHRYLQSFCDVYHCKISFGSMMQAVHAPQINLSIIDIRQRGEVIRHYRW